MITEDNKKFLKFYFNINCDEYSDEKLYDIVNKLNNYMDNLIIEKQNNISDLLKELLSEE